eukprot:7384670-Prymnesium_polylepis.2
MPLGRIWAARRGVLLASVIAAAGKATPLSSGRTARDGGMCDGGGVALGGVALVGAGRTLSCPARLRRGSAAAACAMAAAVMQPRVGDAAACA